jgi:hypothetical protein
MQVQTKDSAFTTKYTGVSDALAKIVHDEGSFSQFAAKIKAWKDYTLAWLPG